MTTAAFAYAANAGVARKGFEVAPFDSPDLRVPAGFRIARVRPEEASRPAAARSVGLRSRRLSALRSRSSVRFAARAPAGAPRPAEKVYKPDILGKPETIYKKPGYDPLQRRGRDVAAHETEE
jgi:hypothetical protein